MAKKVLGQSAPAATTLTTLGAAVPASREWTGSTLVVCNRGGTDTTFRVAVSPSGAAIANQHYIVYDAPIAANDMVAITIGITMTATDLLRVYGGNANLSFTLFGDEAVVV